MSARGFNMLSSRRARILLVMRLPQRMSSSLSVSPGVEHLFGQPDSFAIQTASEAANVVRWDSTYRFDSSRDQVNDRQSPAKLRGDQDFRCHRA